LNIEISFGVPENQRVEVAKILYDTFEDKYRIFFGDKNKFLALASNCLRDDRTLVALKDGIAVGVAGLECEGKNFLDASLHQTVKVFGLGALRVGLFDALSHFTKTAKNELLIDTLAVSADERGKGIGSKLFHSVIDYARSNGFYRIKLEVIETNQNARRLYERIGFTEFKVTKIPYPFNRLLGFGSVTEMIYML
jgi:ribosomal protein S18 acetylase RimI-like enzyme